MEATFAGEAGSKKEVAKGAKGGSKGSRMEVAKAVGRRQQKEQKGDGKGNEKETAKATRCFCFGCGSWAQKAKSQCRDLGEKAVGHLLDLAGMGWSARGFPHGCGSA